MLARRSFSEVGGQKLSSTKSLGESEETKELEE